MSRIAASALLLLAATAFLPAAAAQTDKPGSQDFPGISRMPNTFINNYSYSKFDSFAFPVAQGKAKIKQPVEGQKYFIYYKLKTGNPPGSALETVRNYQNAVRAKGGQVLFEDLSGSGETTLRFRKDDTEIWVYVYSWATDYQLTIVAKQAMVQQVTVDAAAMASSIADTGSVALYGINFDTGKSDIKPESEPAIDQIAKLLADHPDLKVYIVGHTDMVGDAAINLKLSMARAQAVIDELVKKQGVAASRLIAFGNGPYAPIASNKTEEGRARNRRVELVEIATQ